MFGKKLLGTSLTEINLVSRHLSYLIKVLYYKSLIRIHQKIHIVICFYKTDNLAVSLWRNIFNWTVALIQNGDPKSIDDVVASFFLVANDLLKGPYLNSSLVLVSACLSALSQFLCSIFLRV